MRRHFCVDWFRKQYKAPLHCEWANGRQWQDVHFMQSEATRHTHKNTATWGRIDIPNQNRANAQDHKSLNSSSTPTADWKTNMAQCNRSSVRVVAAWPKKPSAHDNFLLKWMRGGQAERGDMKRLVRAFSEWDKKWWSSKQRRISICANRSSK